MPNRAPLAAAVSPDAAALLDSLRGPAILLSPDYRILAANRAYRSIYGDARPLAGRHCYAVSHHYDVPCDQAGECCPLRACLDSGQPQRVLHLHHTPQGEEHVDVSVTPLFDEQGKVIYLLERLREVRSASTRPAADGLVGRSAAFNRMLELVERVAPSDTTVLLHGESGTGKELVARAVHEDSPRHAGPFVAVECPGLSETLFESELFGHERGAFTGAHSRKIGLVEAAHGGTLFLDEVGDIPLSQQVKLLRLLETGSFRRVGAVEPRRADFRLVLATHRDLEGMVAEGSFREDLYYRISAFPVHLPPLRERADDLPLLVESLLRRLVPDGGLRVGQATLDCLADYAFPGNVRELRNILERAVLMADGDEIRPEHLPARCCAPGAAPPWPALAGLDIVPLATLETQYLRWAAARFDGDRRTLARKLGISERSLYRRLQRSRRGD
ncbi:MAG TPA: AAA family ATPase [Gammaproteobacteria bacterium]|nr:AAA family ATPase [Gammaproteobacteria bacterium]